MKRKFGREPRELRVAIFDPTFHYYTRFGGEVITVASTADGSQLKPELRFQLKECRIAPDTPRSRQRAIMVEMGAQILLHVRCRPRIGGYGVSVSLLTIVRKGKNSRLYIGTVPGRNTERR